MKFKKILALMKYIFGRFTRHIKSKHILPKPLVLIRKILRGPESACIGVANACNFNCIFCPTHFNGNFDKSDNSQGKQEFNKVYMDLNLFKNIIDDLYMLETRKVRIQGLGEPFMHPKIEKMIEMVKSKGMQLSIVTNASLITDKYAKALVDLSVDNLSVSLNSLDSLTYQKMAGIKNEQLKDRVLEAVKSISAYKKLKGSKYPSIDLLAILCKYNYSEAKQIIDFAVETNAQNVFFNRLNFCERMKNFVKDIILTEEDFNLLKDQMLLAEFYANKNLIGTNIGSYIRIYQKVFRQGRIYFKVKPYHITGCVILADGVVYPSEFPELIGSIKEKSIIDLWYSKRYLKFRKKMLNLAEKDSYFTTNIFCRRCYPEPSYREECRFSFIIP